MWLVAAVVAVLAVVITVSLMDSPEVGPPVATDHHQHDDDQRHDDDAGGVEEDLDDAEGVPQPSRLDGPRAGRVAAVVELRHRSPPLDDG